MGAMKRVFAKSAFVDHERHTLTIDGVEIPWWLADEPVINKMDPDFPILELTLTVLVDGIAIINTGEHGVRVVDPVLGDVGEYARRKVREEMLAAYPDLTI